MDIVMTAAADSDTVVVPPVSVASPAIVNTFFFPDVDPAQVSERVRLGHVVTDKRMREAIKSAMRVTVILLLASLLLLAVALTGLQLVRHRLAAANESISQLKRDLKDSGQALDELTASAKRNEHAQVVLRGQIVAAHALVTRRNQTITRLLNENETLRNWYQSALPDDVARLHARPEFATPDGYLRWLSEGQQLPDTGQPAEN